MQIMDKSGNSRTRGTPFNRMRLRGR